MTLKDVVQTAYDGKIDRLRVGHRLANLTRWAIDEGYITHSGEVTVSGLNFLALTKEQ